MLGNPHYAKLASAAPHIADPGALWEYSDNDAAGIACDASVVSQRTQRRYSDTIRWTAAVAGIPSGPQRGNSVRGRASFPGDIAGTGETPLEEAPTRRHRRQGCLDRFGATAVTLALLGRDSS